ncbi:DUF3857 and transglutaminase domain-containing protein [Puniceicoccaceae bacterium K14]|nr:DUF3857 and transglutaminase domain-containing protein [Puniceicoccaceae bacterium K14]
MLKKTIAFLVVLQSIFFNELAANSLKKLPNWIQEAMELPPPPKETGDDQSGIITLWDEGIYQVNSNGKLTRTIRYAIKVIDNKGSKYAKANIRYQRDSDKILNFKAWTIDSEENVYSYKSRDRTDQAQIRGSIYQESRVLSFDGSNRTHNGGVFAFEYTTERATIFTQHYWRFQGNNPIALSRLSITYPQDWMIRENLRYDAPMGSREGDTVIWEMRNLEARKSENRAPSTSHQISSIQIDIVPPKQSKLAEDSLNFESWESIANYKAKVMDPMAEPTEEIRHKAQEITKNTQNDWEKIKAIGDYTKKLTYAGIWMDVAQGGGYTPRPAAETFRTGYGDCKDKTALFRSMLSSVGINSYSISVNAINNRRVIANIPSSYYFNHCIAAVEVDKSIKTPAVVEDSELGHLLYVDVTSELTPIGELPFDEQDGWVLVGKQGRNHLSKLPEANSRENRIESRIEAELRPDGSLIAILHSSRYGKAANDERSILKYRGDTEYKKKWEKRLINDTPRIRLEIQSIEDLEKTTRNFETQVAFGYPVYAKNMGGKFLVLNPTIIDRIESHPFNKEERTQPIQFRPKMLDLEIKLRIPPGFKVDESIESLTFESEFASYKANVEIEDGFIIYKREFIEKSVTVPASSYPDIQDFYSKIIKAEKSPIVLARAN